MALLAKAESQEHAFFRPSWLSRIIWYYSSRLSSSPLELEPGPRTGEGARWMASFVRELVFSSPSQRRWVLCPPFERTMGETPLQQVVYY